MWEKDDLACSKKHFSFNEDVGDHVIVTFERALICRSALILVPPFYIHPREKIFVFFAFSWVPLIYLFVLATFETLLKQQEHQITRLIGAQPVQSHMTFSDAFGLPLRRLHSERPPPHNKTK